jgi:hypothetical protein
MRIAVVGLGWWGKQIIACLEKSSRFDIAMASIPRRQPISKTSGNHVRSSCPVVWMTRSQIGALKGSCSPRRTRSTSSRLSK